MHVSAVPAPAVSCVASLCCCQPWVAPVHLPVPQELWRLSSSLQSQQSGVLPQGLVLLWTELHNRYLSSLPSSVWMGALLLSTLTTPHPLYLVSPARLRRKYSINFSQSFGKMIKHQSWYRPLCVLPPSLQKILWKINVTSLAKIKVNGTHYSLLVLKSSHFIRESNQFVQARLRFVKFMVTTHNHFLLPHVPRNVSMVFLFHVPCTQSALTVGAKFCQDQSLSQHDCIHSEFFL